MSHATVEPTRMQCMEVWGGNQAVDRSFETAGLKIWAYSLPYGEAEGGGDVYYLSSCASGRITRLLLADVSGHGAGVSKVAIALRDLMRQNVNTIRQVQFAEAMNRQFADYGQQDVFATALVSTFFAPTRTFTLCNAGHPAPLHYRQASGTWEPLTHGRSDTAQVTDTPFGVQTEAVYGELQVKLAEGDMVLCFSDAFTESTDQTDRPLGTRGILQIVRGLDAAHPGSLITQLTGRLRQLGVNNLSHDDATLLLVQANGGGATLKDNLLAPFRLLGSVNDRTDIRA